MVGICPLQKTGSNISQAYDHQNQKQQETRDNIGHNNKVFKKLQK